MSIDEVINYIQDTIREIIASAQPITVQGPENAKSKKSYSKKSSKKSNVKCPRCGAPMLLRNGKNGSFWGCSNYPECKMTADDKTASLFSESETLLCQKIQRRNALLVIFIGAVLATLICLECFILNTTASVPSGLWLKLDTLPKKGDFVLVPIDAFSSTDWVPPDYFRKNM